MIQVVDKDEYAAWIELPQKPVEDPIDYWLSMAKTYPRLARMALDHLTIPAISDKPERIFSLAGLMVTDRCNRLYANIIQAAQCIRS